MFPSVQPDLGHGEPQGGLPQHRYRGGRAGGAEYNSLGEGGDRAGDAGGDNMPSFLFILSRNNDYRWSIQIGRP